MLAVVPCTKWNGNPDLHELYASGAKNREAPMRFRVSGKQAVKVIGCLVFCLFICGMVFLNRTLIMEPVSEFVHGGGSFEKMKSAIQGNLLGDRLRGKGELLSLNGGFARLEGRIRYNTIQRMTNGMLTVPIGSVSDTTDFADNVSSLHRFLEGKGIPFLFVMAPYKGPLDENLLPAGVTDMTNAIGDQAAAQLAERNVPVLDLREEMSRTREQVEKYFYRTDHHWNAEGAFYAYQRIVQAIQTVFPETKMTCTDPALWEKHVLPDWWLGSHGRRVGPLFAGVDDLDFYLPSFETEMSRYSPGVWAYKGDFRKACIREWFIENRDYFKLDNYQRYMGGGYPLSYHRNQHAENQRKLLLIRDSFMLPVECFLSTEFTSIDVLDPREYGKMSEMDYIRLNPPDMVIMMNYPGTIADRYFSHFGEERELIAAGETDLDEITAPSGSVDYAVLPVQLENGKSYVLNLEKIQVAKGAPEGASVVLYDGDSEIDLTIFDIEYGNQFGFRWGFQIPENTAEKGNYHLRLYAGITKGTEGVELVYQGIRLQEYIQSDQ